jgi:hypothetical protein
LQVGDTGPVESARRSNSRVLGSPFSGLSGQTGLILVPSDNFFLENLLSCVKGSIISYQTWFKKMKTAKKSQLIKD